MNQIELFSEKHGKQSKRCRSKIRQRLLFLLCFDDKRAHHSDGGDGRKAGSVRKPPYRKANQKRGQCGANAVAHKEPTRFIFLSIAEAAPDVKWVAVRSPIWYDEENEKRMVPHERTVCIL